MSESVPSIVLVGGRGFGAHHLQNARRLATEGRLHIAAIADPAIAREETSLHGIPVVESLDAALADAQPDIVIIATPIGTHADLCETAMRAGADVLLEKPPVPTFADFERLLAVQRETGRIVQVGFQSLGSHALAAFAGNGDAVDTALGGITRVSAVGLWSRPLGYWKRARWAGRRVLDGRPVVDGVATNPLAHAIATALSIAGIRTADDIVTVETELFRVNDIWSDDTSTIRVTGRSGETVTCALTLCADTAGAEDENAWVDVHGTNAEARLSYTTDVVTVGDDTHSYGRTDLLTNLLEHRSGTADLLVPLADTGAFMRVVEAIRTAPEPTKIDPRFVSWQGEGDDRHPVLRDVEALAREAARSGRTYSELGAPWAFTGRDSVLKTIEIEDAAVATYRDGAATIPFSGPRPYLHPIRTREGVIVSDHHPADHDWHLGLSFAVPGVDGTNFWGGGTYIPEKGYEVLDDHGRIVGEHVRTMRDGFEQRLVWHGADGRAVLTQNLTVTARSAGASAWCFDLDITLVPTGVGDVTLESPGSKGRANAGYGGLFWRLPDCRDARVFTGPIEGAGAIEGEDAVNGAVAPWAAVSAEFLHGPDATGPATIALQTLDSDDPWFVRLAEYPGLGSAIAWDSPTVVPAGAGLRRRYRAIVADGVLSASEVSALLD